MDYVNMLDHDDKTITPKKEHPTKQNTPTASSIDYARMKVKSKAALARAVESEAVVASRFAPANKSLIKSLPLQPDLAFITTLQMNFRDTLLQHAVSEEMFEVAQVIDDYINKVKARYK